MKIIQVAQCFPPAIGGVETHVLKLSKGLVERGHDVSVYCSSLTASNAESSLPAKYFHHEIDGIKIHRFPAIKISKSIPSTVMPSMMKAMSREKGVHVIHAHSYGYFPIFGSYIPSKTTGAALLFTPHFSAETTISSILRKVFDYSIGNVSLRLADRIIAITEIEKSALSRFVKTPSKIDVVPNGVDIQEFQNQTLGETFKLKFDIQGPVVLFVGRLANNKGLNFLVEAMPEVLAKFPSTKFVFVGKDWGMRQSLWDQAKKLGVASSLLLTGPLFGSEFYGAFASADIFVLPSTAGEAFGIVLLEAMASGKPVIASNVGGIGGLVKSNINGFLLPPANAQALSEKILYLFNNPQIAEHFGTVNKAEAETYSWETIVNRIERVYYRTIREK
jgi:glycosyltransferase involved in cell wall biosynthesis